MTNDIAVGVTGMIPGASQLKKPPYLITLERTEGKSHIIERFISLDKPSAINGLIEVKGFFCDKAEPEIIKTFQEILTNTPKELTLELMFPLHRIIYIRSLVFNANKSANQNK